MNERQKICIFVGFGVLFAIFLFPPYTIETYRNPEPEFHGKYGWHHVGGSTSQTIYDWSVKDLQHTRTGEWSREENIELIRWQVIALCLVVFFAFRAMGSDAEKTQPLPSIESASQMP